MGLEKKEIKIIQFMLIFVAVWIVLIIPNLEKNAWWQNQIPPVQYVVYNLGFIMATILILGLPLSYIAGKRFAFKEAIKKGIASWISFSFILDTLQPPFFYDITGKLLIQDGVGLSSASVDRMTGWIYSNLFPSVQNTFWLYFLVYVFTPILVVVLVAYFLAPKQFLRFIKKR